MLKPLAISMTAITVCVWLFSCGHAQRPAQHALTMSFFKRMDSLIKIEEKALGLELSIYYKFGLARMSVEVDITLKPEKMKEFPPYENTTTKDLVLRIKKALGEQEAFFEIIALNYKQSNMDIAYVLGTEIFPIKKLDDAVPAPR